MSKPIALMYHGIIKELSDIPPSREEGAELYDVSLKNFTEQLDLIAKEHYSVNLFYPEDVTQKKILITFDDGECNNLHNAFRVLQARKWPAYFFVTVSRVGKPGYMDWDELKKIRDSGMLVGSHGFNHEPLTELSSDDLENGLEKSKDLIEQNLKVEVKDLSIPRGFYNKEVIDMALGCGYKNVFVSEVNPSNPACIGRVAVKSDWNLNRFKQALEGKVPAGEAVFNAGKGVVKGLIGSKGYNKVRGMFLGKGK